MKFVDTEVDQLDTRNPDHLVCLLSKLCGQPLDLSCRAPQAGSRCGRCGECNNYELLGKLSDEDKWNVATLNQALLLVKQLTVSTDFYSLFFRRTGRGQVLKKGITYFRGMAMLRFGSFRFAYKNLAKRPEGDLRRELGAGLVPPDELSELYRKRGTAQVLIDEIEESKRWYLGYISGGTSEAGCHNR